MLRFLTQTSGKASVDALSLATGPVKWELELFSSKEHESVGFIHFEFHMEQFTQVSERKEGRAKVG